MTRDEKAELVGSPGKRAEVGGKALVLAWPTPADLFTIDEKMAELARQWCQSPLAHVHSIPDRLLSGPDRLAAIAAALDRGAGGGVMPAPVLVIRAYNSLDGLRYRVWRLTRKTHPELTEADVAALVTEDNRPDVIEALDRLLEPLDPKSGAAPGGAASSG